MKVLASVANTNLFYLIFPFEGRLLRDKRRKVTINVLILRLLLHFTHILTR